MGHHTQFKVSFYGPSVYVSNDQIVHLFFWFLTHENIFVLRFVLTTEEQRDKFFWILPS
jgi:hypothetical protein